MVTGEDGKSTSPSHQEADSSSESWVVQQGRTEAFPTPRKRLGVQTGSLYMRSSPGLESTKSPA